MIRVAKIFTGTSKSPNYREELQFFNGKEWVAVPTVWASEVDEIKFNQAKKYEENNSYR